MPKRFLKLTISILWFFCIGIPSLNAADILDSNCESLSYQSTWPNYSKWSTAKYTTKYLVWGTTISCRAKYKNSCVVVRADNTVSLAWNSLADSKGDITTFAAKYYQADYDALKAFRDAVANGKIVVRSTTDDRYTVKNPTDTATRAILAKIQNNPTATMFNWGVILDAYQYIVEQVNAGLADDIKNNRTYSATIVRNPKDLTFGEKTACAKIQKLFDAYKKYGQKVAITEADFNGCFAYQAYCTENFAMSGITRDVQKLIDTSTYCMAVLKAENASKYNEKTKESCKKSLENDAAIINTNLADLNYTITQFNKTMATQSPATLEYFKTLRDKYQKIANDMAALIETTKADLKKELQDQLNYNKVALVGEACMKVMGGGDKDNTYTQALQKYVTAYPVAASNNGVAVDSNKTNAEVQAEYEASIKSMEGTILTGPADWNTNQTASLIKTCTGISDLAITKITEAKKKNIAAMLTDAAEYDVVAKLWNKTINQINTICNSEAYNEAYDSNSTLDAVISDMVKADAEEFQRTTMVSESTGRVNPREAEFDMQCEANTPALTAEELKAAEDLFNGLFTPVIEYDKTDGTKGYLGNPIPRLVGSKTFVTSTGMDEIMESSFKAACQDAHVRHYNPKENHKAVLKKSVTGIALMASDNEILGNMNTALTEIKKDKIGTCAYEDGENTVEVISQDGITVKSNTKNEARVKLMAKYISLTPGLFQEYISQNPDPIACSILSAAYDNEEFNDFIKPVLGVANIALLIGSFIPYTAIPCRAGLIIVSVADGAVTMSNVFDQLNTMDFVNTAVNSGMMNYQTGDALQDNVNNAMFWNYVSLTADALIFFQAAKGFQITSTVAKEATVTKTVVQTLDDIPSVYPLNEVGQVATEVGGNYTAVSFRLPTFLQPFKVALAKFVGGMMIYANSLAGITISAIPKVAVATEQVAVVSTKSVAISSQIFSGAAKISAADTALFFEKLGMPLTQTSSVADFLSGVAKTLPSEASTISGKFITVINPVTLSGATAITGIQAITLIGDYSYTNYFFMQDGVLQRYSQISLTNDKSLPNTEGTLGDGAPVNGTLQAELDNAISEYNKYCTDITGAL